MSSKQAFVYMLANKHNTTLYVGVTSDLDRRLYEHRNKLQKGFTAKYNLDKLVYFETGTDIQAAIEREKYIKGKTRAFKNALIESINPDWQDLLPEPSCHPEPLRHPEQSEGTPVSTQGMFRSTQHDCLRGEG